MVSLNQLLADVDGSIGRQDGRDRARTLSRITELFVGGAETFDDDQIDLFDAVIQRLARSIELRARIDLAERLARLPQAPAGVVRSLAEDDIVVARPILAGSPRLDDQALMAIAVAKGRDHMLAICERPHVAACVTDVLVSGGDAVVRHAIAGNRGACFSPGGVAILVGHARRDEALGGLLADRTDLPADTMRRLVEIAKDAARLSLLAALPGADRAVAAAIDRGAASIGVGPVALRTPAPPTVPGPVPTETDLAGFAAQGRLPDALAALSVLTGLSAECLERIFDQRDNDLLIVIGKAKGWSWATVKALLRLRDPALTERHHVRRQEETFDGLVPATAARVIHFLKVREAIPAAARPERVRLG